MSEVQARRGVAGRSRRGRALVAGSIVLALIGGGVWWWAYGDSTVEVPDRICGGALPGSAAAAVLPKEGTAYEERSDNEFGKGEEPGVWCNVGAGSQSIIFSSWWSVSDLGARGAERSGNTAIQLGQSKGYTNEIDAELYVSCRGRSASKEWLKVRVARYRGMDRPRDGQAAVPLAELVGDAARYVANELGCEGASKIPRGVPSMKP
ncbi:hypothetical protein [Streptomyces sp. NBC_00057]|uniref:hypothetical protein n=1 Tax=Streptomyces sp. NBC_00057 TaxID=2975634 RepID=UPI00324BD292